MRIVNFNSLYPLLVAEQVVKKYINRAPSGIFDCRNEVNDIMIELYSDENIKVDICEEYGYFEVFGLSREQFNLLKKYYEVLCLEVFDKWNLL